MIESSRRMFLGLTAGGIAGTLGLRPARAQSGGILERLRREKIVKIGIVNQPPYSELKMDGSIDGASAIIVKLIMERLGIPKIEAFTATYGQVIPGLQAGRWDMIGASLVVTKPRCEQVLYGDPIIFGSASLGYLKSEMPAPPASIQAVGALGVKVGLISGSNYIPVLQKAVTDPSNIVIYADDLALTDGLLAKRHQVTLGAWAAMRSMQVKRPGAFEVIRPVTDLPSTRSGPSFRNTDVDFYEAYQVELRKMMASGEVKKIVESNDLEAPTDGPVITAERACSEAI